MAFVCVAMWRKKTKFSLEMSLECVLLQAPDCVPPFRKSSKLAEKELATSVRREREEKSERSI